MVDRFGRGVLLFSSYCVFAYSLLYYKAPSTSLQAVDLTDMPGSTAPLKKFDPLGLANVGSEETFRWFQASYVSTIVSLLIFNFVAGN